MAAYGQREKPQNLENRYGKKNNYMDISSYKLARLNKWWKRNFEREPESLLIAKQNNAVWTDYIEAETDNTQQNCKCRLCGDRKG